MPEFEEMVDLLRYANYSRVAKALNVSKNAVSEWAHGRDVSPYRVRQVRDLLRPPQPEPQPPEWAERLLAGVMVLERKGEVTAGELDQAEADAVAWLATARQRSRQQRGGGGAGGAAGA